LQIQKKNYHILHKSKEKTHSCAKSEKNMLDMMKVMSVKTFQFRQFIQNQKSGYENCEFI